MKKVLLAAMIVSLVVGVGVLYMVATGDDTECLEVYKDGFASSPSAEFEATEEPGKFSQRTRQFLEDIKDTDTQWRQRHDHSYTWDEYLQQCSEGVSAIFDYLSQTMRDRANLGG